MSSKGGSPRNSNAIVGATSPFNSHFISVQKRPKTGMELPKASSNRVFATTSETKARSVRVQPVGNQNSTLSTAMLWRTERLIP